MFQSTLHVDSAGDLVSFLPAPPVSTFTVSLFSRRNESLVRRLSSSREHSTLGYLSRNCGTEPEWKICRLIHRRYILTEKTRRWLTEAVGVGRSEKAHLDCSVPLRKRQAPECEACYSPSIFVLSHLHLSGWSTRRFGSGYRPKLLLRQVQ